MAEIALIMLSLAFSLRAFWGSKKASSSGRRTLSGWRSLGWFCLALILGLALRPRWDMEGLAPFLVLAVLVLSVWIVLDASVRRGGKGTLGRTMFGHLVLISSIFTLMWFRFGPAMNPRPLLTISLLGEQITKTVTWQLPGGSPRTENLPHYQLLLQNARQNDGNGESQAPLTVLGDVLSVRAQRIRLWWPLELLGFPPLVWIDGIRGEYLSAAAAKDFPMQFHPLDEMPTLLGPSLQSWCTLVWQKAFRSGVLSWWMDAAQLESAGISLVREDGLPHKGIVDVWVNGTSIELQRRTMIEPPSETHSWVKTIRSWCPEAICGALEESQGTEQAAEPSETNGLQEQDSSSR
jgi:hypothetical protein